MIDSNYIKVNSNHCYLSNIKNLNNQQTEVPAAHTVEEGSSSAKTVSPMELFSVLKSKCKKKNKLPNHIERVLVGELHEKWRFPSDHLPIGVKIDDFQVVSWNVLNNVYMNWVTEKDSQGLKNSLISELDIPIQADGLTKRDQYVVKMIHSMINLGNDMLTLQECGGAFLTELEGNLPLDWKVLKMSEASLKDQDVIVYNSALFSYRPDLSTVSIDGYPSFPGRPIQNAAFEKGQTNQIVRIFNAHIPGDPNLPGKEEFAQYVRNNYSRNEVTIALGDHNFERHEMLEAYQKAGFSLSEFSFHTPWHTNIDPYTKESKAIDHIFVKGASSKQLKPEDIVDSYQLRETIELLYTPVKKPTPAQSERKLKLAAFYAGMLSMRTEYNLKCH
jgi:hypothetical protein